MYGVCLRSGRLLCTIFEMMAGTHNTFVLVRSNERVVAAKHIARRRLDYGRNKATDDSDALQLVYKTLNCYNKQENASKTHAGHSKQKR